MICYNCGFQLPDGLSFCTNCGASVAAFASAQGRVPDEAAAPGAVEQPGIVIDLSVDEPVTSAADLDAQPSIKIDLSVDDPQPADAGGAPASGDEVSLENLGESLKAAVVANQEEMDSISERAQAQVEAAFSDFPQPDANQPTPPAGYDYDQGMGEWSGTAAEPEPVQASYSADDAARAWESGVGVIAGAAVAGAGAASANAGAASANAGGPTPPPFYQGDVQPNAHYSSQRSYDANAYGQGTGHKDYQNAYQQPSYGQQSDQYQQPSYNQPKSSGQTWGEQTYSNRAYAMILYISGIIGMIIGLCVRDRNDEFITHHLNNVVVIFIGCILGSFLSAVIIGLVLLVYLLVMTIMGMISAYHGDTKELPLIGKIHIIK